MRNGVPVFGDAKKTVHSEPKIKIAVSPAGCIPGDPESGMNHTAASAEPCGVCPLVTRRSGTLSNRLESSSEWQPSDARTAISFAAIASVAFYGKAKSL